MTSFAFRPRPRVLIVFFLTVLALGAALLFVISRSGGTLRKPHAADRLETQQDLDKFGANMAMRSGGERPGQIRAALRQKAHLSDDPKVSGANGTWQPLGKGPLVTNDPTYQATYGDSFGFIAGRISDYTYDASTNRLWATVAQGGVWESDDRGDNWYSISDGAHGLPAQSAGGIAWTPAGGDGGTLIVLTGDHAFSNDYAGLGAYFTTDGGKHWTHSKGIPDGALSFTVTIDPTNPKRVYAATGFGLYRSDDAGRSFEDVNLPTAGCAGETYNKPDCFYANIVTGVQVQGADKFGHKGGAVAAAVGWRAGQYPNFNGKPQAPANGIYVSDTGNTGKFQKVADGKGITATDSFGRTELGAANGPGQNSGYLYAIVQNSKYFTNGAQVENDVPDPDDPIFGSKILNDGSVLDGIYVSSDFGKNWTVMEDHNTIVHDEANGSAINALTAAHISAGYQTTYNEWIKPDPTQTDANGVPTHLVFGMEELWQNDIPGQPMNTRTRFTSFAPYEQSAVCLVSPETCGQTQPANPNGYTTHPDQHGAILLPGTKSGVDLIAGNDGGNYRQHSDSGSFSRSGWGPGNQNGFHTLLPYGVAMSKDGTVYAGLQDNGEMRIDPKTGVQNGAYVGDGVFTLTNPDKSDEAIEELPGGFFNRTNDGGKTWSDMSPVLDDADFVAPLEQDPANYKHIASGGRQIVESTSWIDTTPNCYREPDKSDETPDCLATESSTDWQPVFDLGTHAHPADISASESADDPANLAIAMRVRGPAVYVGFCGSCDPVKLHQKFASGIATNVGGDKPPKTGTSDGWHIAAAKGLPNRIITGIEIDPKDANTIYVTFGSSAARPFAPLGSLGDEPASGGYVYVSHDAGATFSDISGDLPKVQATWVRIRGSQLVVADAIGVFISADLGGKHWAALGKGFPSSPVYSFQFEPQDPDRIVVASYGRGVWQYDFKPRGKGPAVLGADVAGGNRPKCGDHAGPTSRFLRNIKKAAKRKGKGLILRGTANYKKCKGGPNGKVKRVLVTLKFQQGKRCRYLTKKGRLGPLTSCKRKPRYFLAKGTGKWTFKVRGPLPPGRYLGLVKATDNIGNRERVSRHRNFRHFRLKGRAVIAGWHGHQRESVPPPGHK